jgi:cysteine synthase A
VSEELKRHFPSLKTYAVEPEKSPVIGGGTHTPHKLQGIGTGFIPANLHTATLDGTIAVSEEDSFEFTRRAAREEGIFVGTTSGAALAAVAKKLPELPDRSRVLTFCYDTGERYLSVEGLFPAA